MLQQKRGDIEWIIQSVQTEQTQHLQENMQVYNHLGLKCAHQIFFCSKDSNLCQEILLLFRKIMC